VGTTHPGRACRLKADCSPRVHRCCTDGCAIAAAGVGCRKPTDCTLASVCDGRSRTRPYSSDVPAGCSRPSDDTPGPGGSYPRCAGRSIGRVRRTSTSYHSRTPRLVRPPRCRSTPPDAVPDTGCAARRLLSSTWTASCTWRTSSCVP